MYTNRKQKIIRKINTPSSPGLHKTIRAEVKFGTPSDDCRGLGICKVIPRAAWQYQDLRRSKCSQAKAYVGLSNEGDLEFHFVRGTMCALTIQKYFKKRHFIVNESIDLPEVIVNQLNLDHGKIRSGAYPIREIGELLTVVFHS